MYKEILKEISIEYEKKRDRKLREQMMRKEKVYREVPAIKKIDEEIFKIGLTMSKSILNNPDNYKEVAEKAKQKIEKLKMEKAYLMTESNIPVDYMDIDYDCYLCKDTGYLENGTQCNCLKQALVSRAYKMSNIENVLKKENFQTFNINVFKDEAFENEPLTPRENMKEIVGIAECKNCGDLNNIVSDIEFIRNKQKDITSKLGNLVDKYIKKIDDLLQLRTVKSQYNKDETIVEFVRTKYPKKIEEISKMMSIIRYDWAKDADELINLVNDLYPIINEYINGPNEIRKKGIEFNKVIKNVSKNIELSGYKAMTISQFERELIKEIDKIKNEYDVIIIKE